MPPQTQQDRVRKPGGRALSHSQVLEEEVPG
ncbi:hypothetical protein Pla144_11120 [Bythopirellula polymerisocia]|uniref:Uncharacterized protein n=1 Tax=Bythopirellula polymerisocia TaxID=2528003 RepID=A0A5C6D538_9BACT|nr:hypothetical protein Pla144_11120 [Bythopirellula polymerisocia]